MAARSVLKLLGRSLYSSLEHHVTGHRSLSSTAHAIGLTREFDLTRKRSYSQPARNNKESVQKETFIYQIRNISKSSTNLKGGRHQSREDDDYPAVSHSGAFRYEDQDKQPRSPPTVVKPLEPMLESDVRYEIAGSSKETDDGKSDVFDVLSYMQTQEINKPNKVFPHLQPNNIRPFGANDNLFFVNAIPKRKPKITYPKLEDSYVEVVEEPIRDIIKTSKKDNSIQYREDLARPKPYPGHQEARKIAVFEKGSKTKQGDINRKSFSTSSRSRLISTTSRFEPNESLARYTARKFNTAIRPTQKANIKTKNALTEKFSSSKLVSNVNIKSQISKNTSNKTSSMTFLSKKKSSKKVVASGLPLKVKPSLWLLNKQTSLQPKNRNYSTCPEDIKPEKRLTDFVTVKLKDVQEKCRQTPRKAKSGRLPKFVPADCPCVENPPMKEAAPLKSLKPRFVYKDPERICLDKDACPPRADDNYKIVKKSLPKIEVEDCPCVETEMTDFTIKRLPKKHIPEPPKICNDCVGAECCPPRADDGLKIGRKVLPVLPIPDCPCVDAPQMKDVPLRRLKAKHIPEPPRICIDVEQCNERIRADYNLKVTPKSLPKLAPPECACLETPPMKDAMPLKRLNLKFLDPPRICPEDGKCADAIRADDHLEVKRKKLPSLPVPDCPCLEPEPMKDAQPLKRLKPRPVEERKSACVDKDACPKRADEGMVIKPKSLPKIIPGECPCIEFEILDTPPLKRLKPKPVEEPKKICNDCVGEECCPPRSDHGLQVKKKNLPYIAAPDCPCVEPPPMKDCKPLARLKGRPVNEPERICPDIKACNSPRADEGLEIKSKQLPKLEVPDCPCTEEAIQKPGKPLKRLKKIKIKEPPRICPAENMCDESVRADKDDWMYWKQVEAKKDENDAIKEICKQSECQKTTKTTRTGKRYFSSLCTSLNSIKPPLYNVGNLTPEKPTDGPYNIFLDVRGSSLLTVDKNLNNVKYLKPVDYVGLVVYNPKIKPKSGKVLQENKSNIEVAGKEITMFKSFLTNTCNRFISTCNIFSKSREEPHLQPKNPIVHNVETFIVPYPADEQIEAYRRRSRSQQAYRKEHPDWDPRTAMDLAKPTKDDFNECASREEDKCDEDSEPACVKPAKAQMVCEAPSKPLTLWERIVNYFKARPCPSPEEFKMMRLREDAERAAAKAGLCLYDPMEDCKKSERELPKVITGKKPCHEE